ncbi:MAG: hypothetical protein JF616_00690, partial [Fibrobacteres bacterium]|nr:hypothetical protein [Fibrobacterota bacterium]
MRLGSLFVLSPKATLAALLLGLPVLLFAKPTPIVELLMTEGTGNTLANTGAAGGSASRPSTYPSWSTSAPVNGGTFSLDYGTTVNSTYYVEMGTPATLKNLKSFTISGWINSKNLTVGAGGNRILTFLAPAGGQGIDLALQADGSLGLGINQWNDQGGVRSNGGKITADASASYNNWRFFAVTYNSLLSSNQVSFYFGSNGTVADWDCLRTYARGNVGSSPGNTLALGNINSDNRYSGSDQMVRGLLDQIRVFGSATDGSAALTAADIATIQSASPITGQGVLYEEWTGVTGTSIEDLVTGPAYPSNPSATLVRPSFDGFQNRADNFGVRMSGWIKAPESGNYTFWISADYNAELRVSSDANPVNKTLIASLGAYSNYLEWERYPSQKSAAVSLTAGKFYYIEALMKEGTGNDHVEVGWKLPSGPLEQPIPAGRMYLRPSDGDELFPSTLDLYDPGTSNSKITLGWHKETGNNYSFLTTEGSSKLKVFNDILNLPSKKMYFGDNNEANAWGFRSATTAGVPTLYVEQSPGTTWAMRFDGATQTASAKAEFNNGFLVNGPQALGDTGFASMDYRGGTNYARTVGTDPLTATHWNASVSAQAMNMSETVPGETNVTTMYAGSAYFSSTTPNTIPSVTSIEGGIITAQEVRTNTWRIPPDYVFEKGYSMKSLEEVERYVQKNKHLPEIPSAQELKRDGLAVGDMHMRLLKSMEEMTLRMIELNKEVKSQKAMNAVLEHKIEALEKAREG